MKKTARLDLVTPEGSSLRFRARTDSDLVYHFDSGPDVADPSPIDALIAALGACSGMDVISILRKKRQQVTAYTIELEGDRSDEHPKSFTRIELVHRVRGRGISRAAVEEAVRLSEEKYCSVHANLAPGATLTSRIELEEEATAASG
jgi:putative redox protein